MDLRIADTFTDSLARLTPDEQRAVKTTAFDLHLDPSNPGMSFHKLDRAKDKNFWSVRVNADVRLIVHRTPGSLLLCYVDHHDKAYAWAERRKLETHPTTGAAQFVEIREAVREVVVPVYVHEAVAAPKTKMRPLFASVADEVLLSYGVPAGWLADVKAVTEETLFGIADHLPAEAAEALLELATGGKPRAARPPVTAANPFEHPDALRRFRVMSNVEELQRALDFPWEKWTIFLHPDQRQTVERDYGGPARVSGSAGTGKTIVALHRAVHLARANPDARVLLTTYSDALANALHARMRRLLGSEPVLGERIDVISLPALGLRLHRAHVGPVAIADRDCARGLVISSAVFVGEEKLPIPFLVSEWEHVVDAWQLATWEAYRDVQRLGRKVRVPEAQRAAAWRVFERTRAQLRERGLVTEAGLFDALSVAITKTQKVLFDHAVVDEAQDLGVAHVRFFAALAGGRPNALFFAGDLGQRIFQQPFSWKALGVDVRGRSRTLRVNYRTSHQIRAQADRLLGASVSDADGNAENRSTVSVFNGPPPEIETFAREAEEVDAVAKWIAEHAVEGPAHEIGVFVRSEAEIERAQAAVAKAGLAARVLDDRVETASGKVSVGTMHLAKGLEFRAVAVMACDDDAIPSQVRIAAVGDAGDLQEIYDTERQLLYVACTRARDRLMVTGVEPGSEFLDDLRERRAGGAPA
ncbi:3'-5' exonuclease [Sorangium sp. So ce1151]|uniref:3'-5' exonuclease n=1 Tax=Sorangium sp. So ce1151 TaxID=3133332 RepID=UPI003F5E0580